MSVLKVITKFKTLFELYAREFKFSLNSLKDVRVISVTKYTSICTSS